MSRSCTATTSPNRFQTCSYVMLAIMLFSLWWVRGEGDRIFRSRHYDRPVAGVGSLPKPLPNDSRRVLQTATEWDRTVADLRHIVDTPRDRAVVGFAFHLLCAGRGRPMRAVPLVISPALAKWGRDFTYRYYTRFSPKAQVGNSRIDGVVSTSWTWLTWGWP